MIGTLFLVTILFIQIRMFLTSPELFRDVMLVTLLVSGITETAFYTRYPGTMSTVWMFTIALAACHVVARADQRRSLGWRRRDAGGGIRCRRPQRG